MVVRRFYSGSVKTTFLLLNGTTLLLLAACSTPVRPVGFAGSYQGAAIHSSNPYGESLVEGLDVTERAGSYSLEGYMNDTNREPGMDHTSNTRWQWNGTGTVQGDSLAFSYSSAIGERGTGSLRQERTGFLLTLDQNQYQLHRAPP